MDIAAYLQRFESSMSTYAGDDPLEQWDKFVELLERKLPPFSTSQLSLVFNRLVETFLDVDKYSNDERYVNYCIKYASSYPDPIALYSHIFSKGVGTRSAALYVSWAQHLEQRCLSDQAEVVFQKALENQAQPAELLLCKYKQFQLRTKPHVAASRTRTPFQNCYSANVMPAAQNKDSAAVNCHAANPTEPKYVIMVSRSEYSGKIPPSSNDNMVAAYDKQALQCEGSELCFEEVRAQRYFHKLQEQRQQEQRQQEQRQQEPRLQEPRLQGQRLQGQRLQGQRLQGQRLQERSLQDQRLQEQEDESQEMTSEKTQDLGHLWMNIGRNFHSLESTLTDPTTSLSPVTDHLPTEHLRLSARSQVLRPHSELALVDVTTSSEPDSCLDTKASAHGQSHLLPVTGSSQQVPAPAACTFHQASFSDANVSHHAPVPAASLFHHAPRLTSDPENDIKNSEEPFEPEHEANMSQGRIANLSHTTPNNSLGYIQATPSRVLPSPTVNTREALDVIMDMFQAPTLLEDHYPNEEYDIIYTRKGPSVKPETSAPFAIFQDEEGTGNKENSSVVPAVREKVKPRALAELHKPTKPNDTPADVTPDESTMWGAEFRAQNSLAACPNSTSDFAMLAARFVSTPFTHKASIIPEQEVSEGTGEDFVMCHSKKLSPIMEQSPSEEKVGVAAVARESPASRHGTIVGEGVAMVTQLMTTSSTTMVQLPPPAVLSFRDQTLCSSNTPAHRSTGPAWEVYTSPKAKSEPFTIMEDVEESAPEPPTSLDVPMSPESGPRPDWLTIEGPQMTEERDIDAFLSPHPRGTPRASRMFQDVPMSPQVELNTDSHMTSPDRDVWMHRRTPRPDRTAPAPTLLSDPWNDELIAHLLASVDPPLTAHPRCVTWQCNLPNIAPKMTLSMGNASLMVDCVLGEGAFAKVYQATDPMTSDKMVLKVQKPANPWEFYINTQLDARVPPSVRHFYSSFHSAHLFINGSVLVGEMHSYGTLLNAVNMYRAQVERVMPQPLVLYFSACILHMVEQLHSAGIIHADVKPDNFLLGERFLENRGFQEENVDHGLVLIDLGQSIDMRLFPEGTAFTAKCLTSGFQCTEMQTGKAWSYQTDYFGVAGTVYCMLFGTYMQVVNDGGIWRTNGVFRRNPHGDVWQEFFHTLLNVPGCGAALDLRRLRLALLSVLQHNYRSKLASLKSRLVVRLLESSRSRQRT